MVRLEAVRFYDARRTGNASLADGAARDIWGATIAEPDSAAYGEIYLDVSGAVSKERLLVSLGHEVVESEYLRGRRNLLIADDRETREAMADRFGMRLTERLVALGEGGLGTSAAWREGVWSSDEVADGTWRADRLGVVETRNLEWLAAGRDQFGAWAEQTLTNVGELEGRNAGEYALAGFAGVGAGVTRVGEGLLATANYVGNWVALATVDQFNEEWGMAHAEELRQSHEAIATFFREFGQEEVRAEIGLAAWDTLERMAEGDTRAIGEVTSFFGALGTGALAPGARAPRLSRELGEIPEARSTAAAAGEIDVAGSVGAARTIPARNERARPDFYVGITGEDSTLPATGYRYMRYKNDDGTVNKYVAEIIKTKQAPGSYIGFEDLGTGKAVRDAYQIRGPEFPPSWSDGRLKGTFDTLQVYKNGKPNVRVPYEYGDTGKSPELFTRSYPEYGKGGKVQLKTDQVIKFDRIDILPEE